jgi:hypothetical protein
MIHDNPSKSGQPYPAVARVLKAEVREDDLIVVHSIPSGVVGVARYLADLDTGAAYLPWIGQLGQRTSRDLDRLIQGRARVILVETHTVWDPTPLREWLATLGRRTESRWHEGVLVESYALR